MVVPNTSVGAAAATRQRMIILRYFFVVVCVISYGYFLSKLLPTIIDDVNKQEDNDRDHAHTLSSFKSSKLSNNAGADNGKCGIWMAPSSLNPYPGYGIFTTRDINNDESILHAPDAVSISLHDMRRRHEYLPLYKERRRIWTNVFSNYVWAYGMPDHSRYDNPPDTVDFQPGFGSLPNHHCILQSLGQAPARIAPYNDGLLVPDHSKNTRESPGLGAFSYNVGRDFYSTRDLKAGEEIFLNYGLCERDHPVNKKMKSDDTSSKSQNWKHQIMYPEDVKEAARILKLYQPFGSKPWPEDGSSTKAIRKLIAKESSSSPTDNTKYSDPDFVLAILIQVGKYDVRQALYEAVDKTTVQSRESLVKTMGENLVRKRDSYKALTTKKLWFELAKLSLEKRDPEWIKEHGLCLEHLVPKKSTLSHAGFGGFSQYGVKYNDIVVPSPVLHVTNKETLMLYRRGIVENKELDLFKKNPDSFKLGMPLLLNYCFGHSESSMLMCPMTSAMLINHCSNRTNDCGPKGPNAEVRWSSGWDIASHEWRNKSLPVIDDHNGRILSLEIVSLRDIAPNEEVFIDYGIEWETAWDKHVREWKPPKKIPNFITAKEANQRKGPIIDDLISGDLRKTVDHPYLFTGCQYDAWDDVSNIGNYTKKWKNKWKMLSDEKILETFASPGDGFVYDGNKGYADHEEYSHWPCSILKAEKQKGRYTIRINMSPLKGVEPSETSWNKNEVPRILTNYPQESIHYFVKASATDQMLPTSFRHSIGFPHKLFPKQWKNRRISNVP